MKKHLQDAISSPAFKASKLKRRMLLAALAAGSFCAMPAMAQLNYQAPLAVNTTTTYTDLGSNGTAITVANNDNADSAPQAIGFTFNYNGQAFTQFVLNTNGYIKLGSTGSSAQTIFSNVWGATATTDQNILAVASGVDLQGAANQTTNPTEFRVHTTGTAPNRVTTIQWENMADKPTVSGTNTIPAQFNTMQFQIRLFETSNNIEFVYGTWTASTNTATGQPFLIGLKGTTGGNTDRLFASKDGSVKAWSQTIFESTYFSGGQAYYPTHFVRNTVLPTAGRTYRFVPSQPNDISVETILTLGKMPLAAAGNSQQIKAVITNTGTNTQTNIPVSLAVTGGTAFNPAPVTIPTLAPGASTTITFPAYVAAAVGVRTATVTVPTDDVPANNTKSNDFEVTQNTFSYAYDNIPDDYIGFGPTSNAAFLSRFNVVGKVRVPSVTVPIGENLANQTVYAVVVNSAGVEVGRSANVVLTLADEGLPYTFNITTPPTFNNEDFYVGLAQPTYTAPQYFPLGVQMYSPSRNDAFFTWSLAGGAVPTANTQGFRFMIDANITDITGVNENFNPSLISVYPNPSNGVFNVKADALKGSNLNIEVRDMQGKVISSVAGSKEGTLIDLKDLASGVYMLRVSTDTQMAVKRIVVE